MIRILASVIICLILGNLCFAGNCDYYGMYNSDVEYYFCDNSNYTNKDEACKTKHTTLFHFNLIDCINRADETSLVTSGHRHYEKYNTTVKIQYDGVGDIKLLSDIKVVAAIMWKNKILDIYGKQWIQDEILIKRDMLKVGDILEINFTHNYQPVIDGVKGFVISFCGEIDGKVYYFCRAYVLDFY
jgi:YHS domain-containing protein